MEKIVKPYIASLLIACLAVTTVVCCCIGPAIMAHLHKASACSHCSPQDSHGHSSSPSDGCMYRLTNAEASHGQVIIASAPLVFTPITFLDHHIVTPFLSSSIQAYPRGSPPLAASFTPLYLRTFSLRI